MKTLYLTIIALLFIQFGAFAQKGCAPDELGQRVFAAVKDFDSTDLDAFRKVLISDKKIQQFIDLMDSDEEQKEEIRERIAGGFFDRQLGRMFERLAMEVRMSELELKKIEYEDFLYELRMRDGVKQLKGEVFFQEGERHFEVRVMAAMIDGVYEVLEIERLKISYELHGYPDDYEWVSDEMIEYAEEAVPEAPAEERSKEEEEMLKELERAMQEALREAEEEYEAEAEEVTEEAVTIDDVHVEKHNMLPEYPGGFGAMENFIYNEMIYPEEAIAKNLTGMVELRFKVLSDGSISGIKVLSSPHQLLTDEAIRIVKSMPKWIPAHQNGEPVATYFSLPVEFEL